MTCTQNGHAKQVAPLRQSDIIFHCVVAMDDMNLGELQLSETSNGEVSKWFASNG